VNINDIRDYMESLGWITQLDDDGMIIQHNDHLLIRYTYNWNSLKGLIGGLTHLIMRLIILCLI
jgi:hypothetical protein